MKYASFKRRLMALLVDLSMIYLVILLLALTLPLKGYIWLIAYLVSLLYYSIGYLSVGGTYGELIFRLQVVVIKDTKFKKLYLLFRALLISITLVPFVFSFFGVIIILFTIIASIMNQHIPQFKERKMLFWESASNTVVIEK